MSNDPLHAYLARPSRRRLARVVAAHHQAVWRLALRLTGSEDDASDIAQDVFLGLFLDPPAPQSVRSPGGFLAWRVVARASRWRRALERRRRREEEHAQRLAAEIAGTDRPSREDLDAVRETLDELPESERVALELRYLAGLSTSEVGATLGIGERAVRLRLERARERLRDRLSPLFAGALVAGGAGIAEASAPPPELLGQLLRALEAGEALAPVVGTAAAGAPGSSIPLLSTWGALMATKKVIVCAAVAALVVCCSTLLLLRQDAKPREAATDVARETAGARSSSATDAALESEPARDVTGAAPRVATASRPALHGSVTARRGTAVADAEVWALDDVAWRSASEIDGAIISSDPGGDLEALRETFAALLEASPRAVTDSDGRYAIPALPAGRYRLVVLAAGYLPHNDTVLGHDGGETERDVELDEGATLAGRVVDPDGDPLAGATIVWRRSSERGRAGIASLAAAVRAWEEGLFVLDARACRSDAGGRFELSYLEPDTFDVAARMAGRLPGAAWDVGAGATDVLLVLESGLAVEGRLVEPSGAPVAGVPVELTAARVREVHRFFDARVDTEPLLELDRLETTSDAEGRFRIGGVRSGRWRLRATPKTRAPLERLVVVETESVSLGDLVLDAPRAIAGRVTDATGRPIAGARVWAARPPASVRAANSLFRVVPEPLVETPSAADGSFRLDGLPDETLDVLADHPERALAVVRDIEPGARDVRVVLAAGLTIAGRVLRGDTDEPVAGATVRLGFGHELESRSDPEGRFELRGVSIADAHRGTAFLRFTHAELDAVQQSVSLQALGASRELVVRMRRLERVDGRVVDAAGAPIADAQVAFVVRDLPLESAGYDPTRGLHARSAADGTFSLPAPTDLRNMIGGFRLALEVERRRFAPSRYEFDALPPAGRPWPEIEIVLERGARVAGMVVSATGEPVPRVRIEALVGDEPHALLGLERSPLPVAFADARGVFELDDLALGPVRILATASGFAPAIVDATATDAGESDAVEIVLERGGELAGRVVSDSGAPLDGVEVAAIPADVFARFREGGASFARRMFLRLGAGIARARSGEDGRFIVGGLPASELTLVARSAGFEAAIAEGLEPGDRVPDLVLTRFSAVVGCVVDAATRAPLREFKVNLVNVEERERLQKRSRMQDARLGSEGELRFHDPDGRFFYDGLRPARYELTVTAATHVFAVVELTLGAGEERELDVPLERGGVVDVQVVMTDGGSPVEGAQVAAFLQGGSDLFRGSRDDVFTDAEGRCRLVGLGDGEYAVVASHPFALRDNTQRSTVEVVAGGSAETVVRMRPAGRLEGRITGAASRREGRTSTRHRIEYRLVGDARAAEGSTGRRARGFVANVHVQADGVFEQSSLLPGAYRLTLVSQDQKDGELIAVGPTSGFSSLEAVGPEVRRDLGEVTIEAGRTTYVEHDVAAE